MFSVHRPDDAGSQFAPRLRAALVFVLAIQLILVGRLWYLQLVQGESYVRMARENRVRLIRLPPARGRILDSTGRVLAGNRPGFTLSIIPGELTDEERVIKAGHEILGATPEDLRKRIDRSGQVPKYVHYALKKNMTLEEVSLIQSRVASLDGVMLETKPLRRYPQEDSLCHVVGTIGEVSRKELAKVFTMGYRPGDLVGKTGIEKEYETALRGEEGWQRIEIDAKGRQLSRLSRKPPMAGADISLTVDVSFQKFVEDAFQHRAGSVIAVDPDTGRILAMVSKPGFDLSLFTPAITTRDWSSLNRDPLHPFENRSIRGLYSPASAFKVVMAAAALAENLAAPEDKAVCTGKFHLGGQTFRCWNRQGHGKVNLRRSLVESCDTYYYNLALKLGPELIAKYAALFGLGKPTGLGLPQELPGLVPTPAWKHRSYGEGWKDGETVTVGIGQSYLVCTPIQIAMMTSALANGGKLLRPSIVRRIQASDGRTIFEHTPVIRWKLPIKPDDMSFIRESMIGSVKDEMGTGKRSRVPEMNIAGKTGTSQVIRIREGRKKSGKVPYRERTHAIFIAFVDDRPQKIAVVVIVEHGGSGGTSAAPIARKVIARYYGLADPGDSEEETD